MAFSKEKVHERAEKYAAKGQHEKAAREYQSIVDHDPKDVRAWLMLADCLARTGDRGGAVQRYLQVADFYAGAKESQKALAVYRQVLNIDPNRLDIHYKCAQLNVEIGRVHDAIASFEQIAQAQLQAGHVSEALKTYRVIADADPSIVSKRLRLAELYSRERMLDEAVEAFRAAGDVLLQSGRKADYVRVAERLVYHKNDDRDTIRQLARVYLELGDARRALMKLNALLQADQADAEGLELLAETFIALGKPDKATSVMVELARKLIGSGDMNGALHVVKRGLDWEPTDHDLLRMRTELEAPDERAEPEPEPEPAPQAEVAQAVDDGEPMELDLDDSDVLELDEDDVILEEGEVEDDDSAGVPQEMPASITSEVMSEVPSEDASAPSPGGDDFDKILFEARVYIKYRLFDHSLDHIQGLLEQHPHHVGALGLKARALTELGRAQEAADTHVEVARQVMGHDPKLALEHVAAALDVNPDHMGAAALQGELGGGGPAPQPVPEEESGVSFVGGEGDSGMFSLDEEEEADDGLDSGTDFAIEVSEPEEEEVYEEPVPRFVENRFGISEAKPLPEVLDEDSGALTEGTPPSGFVPRPPPGAEEPPPPTEFAVEPDQPTGEYAPMTEVVDEPPAPQPARKEPTALSSDLDAGFDELMSDDESAPVSVGPSTDFADISDDLAEIRFYVDQGLDDDARAALDDLAEVHPGHPDLMALRGELDKATGSEVEVNAQSGAMPLMDLVSEEDQEADAYLSAIFGGDSSKQTKERKVEVSAVASDVEDSNARDRFDLGMAYREMGLVDGAITEFEAAATDPAWKSRALVMVGTLQIHRGETDRAVSALKAAVESSTTEDERCEARYELAVVFEKMGETALAIEQLETVTEGYRDRDEKLVELQG